MEMGLLHDVTKAKDEKWGRKVLQDTFPKALEVSPNVWHSFTASIWVKKHIGITDPRILHAIQHHALGDGNSIWDKLLFIADKIDPLRDYDSSHLLKLCQKDLHDGFRAVKESNRLYLKKEGIHV